MNKKISKILFYILIMLLSIILCLNIYIIIQSKIDKDSVPSIFGYKPFIVLSGSMKNEINIGDLVVVKQTNINDINKGDIIAFRDSNNYVVTHRVIEVVQDKEVCFRTKGDNNNIADEDIVCEKSLEGKLNKIIPKLGSLILFIQKPSGFLILILIIIMICMFSYIINNKNNSLVIEDEEEIKEFEEFKKMKNKKNKKK